MSAAVSMVAVGELGDEMVDIEDRDEADQTELVRFVLLHQAHHSALEALKLQGERVDAAETTLLHAIDEAIRELDELDNCIALAEQVQAALLRIDRLAAARGAA